MLWILISSYTIVVFFLLIAVLKKKNLTRTMVAFMHYALPSTTDLPSSYIQLFIDI